VQGRVDWSKRGHYVRTRHAIDPSWADEAIHDEHAVWLVPDPGGRSGHAVRVIGHSPTAGAVLTVILVNAAADPTEKPEGDWWGSNAWLANRRDQRLYGETET
jgi:hypothetical protein